MGDLVKISLPEVTSTLARLEQRDILPGHLKRVRAYDAILDGVEKALKAPEATPFPLEPVPGCKRLMDLHLAHDLLIREWEGYEQVRLPSFGQLQKLHIVEFGEPTTPNQAYVWMLANGFKPVGIGEVAVFACAGFTDVGYGVIGTDTRSKVARDQARYAPYYRSSLRGTKPEVDRIAVDEPLNSFQWHYLAIAEEFEVED